MEGGGAFKQETLEHYFSKDIPLWGEECWTTAWDPGNENTKNIISLTLN